MKLPSEGEEPNLQNDNPAMSDESDDEILAVHRRLLPEVIQPVEIAPIVDGEELEMADDVNGELEDHQMEQVDTGLELTNYNEQADDVDRTPSEIDVDEHGEDSTEEPDQTDADVSDQSSDDNDPPERSVARRDRKPAKVFTFDDDGKAVWQNR